MKFTLEFENEVLARSLVDSMYLKKASRVLEAHHFGTKYHAWTWSQIFDVWTKHKETCKPSMLLARVKRNFDDDDIRRPYIELLKKLFSLKPRHSEASLDELSKFVRSVNAQVVLEKASDALEANKLDKVYKLFADVGRSDLKPKNYTRIKWIEEFDQRQEERRYKREHPDEFISIKTGFRRLDDIISGIQLGELGLVVGTTGRGKSIFLSNLAHNSVKYGHETAYFSFEMPARQIAQRQDSLWTGIKYKKFKEFDFLPSELKIIKSKLKKMRSVFKNKFQIFSMPVRSANINSIKNALEDAKIETGFQPKLLVLDSADHLLPVGKKESFRIDQSSVYWDCKMLAEENGYAIWSSSQGKQEYATKTLTAEGVGESYDKARIADLIVSLNEPKKKKGLKGGISASEDDEVEVDGIDVFESSLAKGKFIELFLAKYRDGISKTKIRLDVEFGKMLMKEFELVKKEGGEDGRRE
jgi:replicative DNA helicase